MYFYEGYILLIKHLTNKQINGKCILPVTQAVQKMQYSFSHKVYIVAKTIFTTNGKKKITKIPDK